MMIGGEPINARAAATRCCWPTLRLAADALISEASMLPLPIEARMRSTLNFVTPGFLVRMPRKLSEIRVGDGLSATDNKAVDVVFK